MRFLIILILTACAGLTSGCLSQRPEPRSGTIPVAAATAVHPTPPPVATPLHRPIAAAVYPASAPQIHAEAAIVIDAGSGQTLYEKNADQIRAVASTQKLLTALLVVERGGLDGMATVRPADTLVEPSKLGVRSGERYPRRSLLNAMMVRSSNDAANVLASDHSGSLPAFVEEMNRKARRLGANHSNFRNPHGLTEPGQYSTARDIARIAWHAYRSPTIRQAALLPGYTFVHNNGRNTHLKTTNLLMGRLPGVNGLKTGYTNASGRCLVTTARSAGRDILIVQLGSRTQFIFNDAERLILWELSQRGGWHLASGR